MTQPAPPPPQHQELHSIPSRAMTRRSTTLSTLDPNSLHSYTTHPRVRGYVDGCFDVMHSGHYNLFRQARSLCDELVVGVHSSEEIEKTKGAAPVQTDVERMRLVGAVKWVDEVVLSPHYSPDYVAVLKQYNCDFCIHGNDVNLNADGKDPFAEVKKLGLFRTISRVDFISSTDIINRLLKATSTDIHEQRRSEAEEDADSYLLTTDRLCQFMNTTRHQPHKPLTGQRVVYVSGSWDLFHSGHVRLLQECKRLGDFLLVGVHEDTTVANHCGKAFPIMNLFERTMNVLGCRDVDEIVFDAPFVITEQMLTFLSIDIVVNPSLDIDYPNDSSDPFQYIRTRGTGKSLTDKVAAFVKKDSERLRPIEFVGVELPAAEVLVSSELMKRIEKDRAVYEERNKNKSGGGAL